MIVFRSEPQSITVFRMAIQFRKKQFLNLLVVNKLQVEGVRGFISFVRMDLNMFEEHLDRAAPALKSITHSEGCDCHLV